MNDAIVGLGRRAFLPRRASLVLLILLVAGLAPPPLGAPPQHSVETTVTLTPQGATASTTLTAGTGAAHHPSRVLVRFQRGVRDFLPGSGAARGSTGDPDLHLVPNPPGFSVAAECALPRSERQQLLVHSALAALATPGTVTLPHALLTN